MTGQEDKPPSPDSGLGQRGILIVDDDPEQALELVDLFRDAGFLAGAATGASEAMEMLGTERPRLMLVDLRMPGMDGWRLARLVQSLDQSMDWRKF